MKENRLELAALLIHDASLVVGRAVVEFCHYLPLEAPDYMSDHCKTLTVQEEADDYLRKGWQAPDSPDQPH